MERTDQYHLPSKRPVLVFPIARPGTRHHDARRYLGLPDPVYRRYRVPNAGIMYSKDRGKTWHLHNLARTNTTEAQVAEVEPGVLMLNMRDNRGGSRAVATTKDLGKTWTEHPSSRSALQESVCMAKLDQGKCQRQHHRPRTFYSSPTRTRRKGVIISRSRRVWTVDLLGPRSINLIRRGRGVGIFLSFDDR